MCFCLEFTGNKTSDANGWKNQYGRKPRKSCYPKQGILDTKETFNNQIFITKNTYKAIVMIDSGRYVYKDFNQRLHVFFSKKVLNMLDQIQIIKFWVLHVIFAILCKSFSKLSFKYSLVKTESPSANIQRKYNKTSLF